MASIDIQPPTLDVSFYAGDGFEFTLSCSDGAGNPIDLTGTLMAQIKIARTDSDIVTTFAINNSQAAQGKLVLSLTGQQTQGLVPLGKSKFAGVWDLQWTPASSFTRTIVQGNVGCTVDVTR